MRILFVFGNGSEVRQFVHSNLIRILTEMEGVELFISTKVDFGKNNFNNFDKVTFLEYFQPQLNRGILTKIEYLLDLVFEKKHNFRLWKFGGNHKSISRYLVFFSNLIAKFGFFYFSLRRIEKLLQKYLNGGDLNWKILLQNNRIEKIVINTPNLYGQLLIEAYSMGVETILLYHTNKDILAQGRLKYPITKYGVWNLKMKSDLQLLFGLDSKILGCSHFVYLTADTVKLYSREYFEFKFGVNLKTDFIVLYTAADPRVIENEHLYVYDLIRALDELNIINYKIIIRKNPMDNVDYWSTFDFGDRIIICEPDWYYNEKVFFNYATESDLSLFKSLLNYSNICINVPSTVTIECALAKLPVLNICYAYSEDIDIISFWKADFYENARNANFVFPIFRVEDFNTVLSKFRDNNQSDYFGWEKYLNYEIPLNDVLSLENTVDFILQ